MYNFSLTVEDSLIFEAFDDVINSSIRWRADHDLSVIVCLLDVLILRGKKTHECRSLSRPGWSLKQNYSLFYQHHLSNGLKLCFIEYLLEVVQYIIEAIFIFHKGFQLTFQYFRLENQRC